jgi:hypothetical protein
VSILLDVAARSWWILFGVSEKLIASITNAKTVRSPETSASIYQTL